MFLLAVLVSALVAVPASATDRGSGPEPASVTGPPLLNQPVFNDPTVTVAGGGPSVEQSAIMDQLIRLIRAVPGDGWIHFAMHEFAPGDRSSEVVDALIEAHDRGVGVQVILDGQEDGNNNAVFALLAAELGSVELARSWVITCDEPLLPDTRGCIARNYLHSKFALFSSVVIDGTEHSNVVFQTSSNLDDWYLYNSYNDSYTFTDAAVYQDYLTYFGDLRVGRNQPVNPGYYWSSATGTRHRGIFLPREQSSGDTIVSILRLVECSYTDADGVTRQTDIRMVLTAFNQHRADIARELLRLRGENCWIDIVHLEDAKEPPSSVDTAIRTILGMPASNGKLIQMTPCRFQVPTNSLWVVPHTKVMMVDGFYDDDIVPRVYTGSANFVHQENSDDSFVRIMDRGIHTQYLTWFYKIRSACQSNG
ncbi:phospholipase D-like domain-containing protein [Actinophytocola xinjiangensis]|uniref:phospholipase D-like domain-containing protein n=1 Tax=Actinophytocola xinjiangensis TaxID=485602 RepID=UPI000A72CC2D|nr:phospholipase D-like domain-containing protein [Actinophytocola xinjiangensis]